MEGLVELAKKKLRLPVRIGRPAILSGLSDGTDEPEYSVGIGLIHFAIEQENRPSSLSSIKLPNIGATVSKVRDWAKTFLP